MDTLRNMQAFVAVARHGGFSAAARELDVATSVVTKRVDQLEWRTRIRLFHRSTRAVKLTEVGAAWLPKVEAAIEAVADVLDGMSTVKGMLHGRIRIKVPTTLTMFYLSSVLFDFQSLHPGVVLDLVLNDRLVNPMEEDFDLVVAGIPGSFPGAVEQALCRSRRVLCAAPSYLDRQAGPRSPADLADHDLLLFGPMGSSWNFESSAGPVTVHVKPKLIANDGQVLLAAALAGKGIALLAQYTVAPAILDRKLVEVLPGFELEQHALRAIIPADKADLPRVQGLVSHLRSALNPVPPWEQVWPSPSR